MNTLPAAPSPWFRIGIGLGLVLWLLAFGAQAALLEAGSAQALRGLHHKLGEATGPQPPEAAHRAGLGKRPRAASRGTSTRWSTTRWKTCGGALDQSSQWCEMLLLHVNNRRCRVAPGAAGETLTLERGAALRQADRPGLRTVLSRIARAQAARDYLLMDLAARIRARWAPAGYRVLVEGMPLGEQPDLPAFRLLLRPQHGGPARHHGLPRDLRQREGRLHGGRQEAERRSRIHPRPARPGGAQRDALFPCAGGLPRRPGRCRRRSAPTSACNRWFEAQSSATRRNCTRSTWRPTWASSAKTASATVPPGR